MRFGVSFKGLHPRFYARAGVLAEQHGFDSLWIGDHVCLPETVPHT